MASPTPVRVNTAGAQPVIDYLTKDYAGFRQGMLNQIPLLMPQWTDRSEADFGVVLIELVAYVADILSYYQDRVANEAFLATATQRRSVAELLRLIDYQIDPGLAASALIHFDVAADVSVAGTTLPYRLKTAGVPGEPDVTFEVTEEFALQALNNAVDLAALAAIPVGSTALVVPRTAHAIAEGHVVYFEQKTSDPDGTFRIRRSPRLTVTAVRDAGLGKDEISWLPPLPEPFQPSSTTLKGNNVVATTGTTIADEPIFVADGTPGQSFTLSRIPVTHLLRPQPSQRLRSQPALEVRVDGVRWERVDSLVASLPSDTHYTTTIDENDYLTVRFGSGARGSVPPAGSQVKATYRIGLGSQGNVGSDTLTVFVSTVPEVKTIANPFPASGGADRESTEEAKISGPGTVIAQERAVTLLDYELLAEAFPGIGKSKARVGLRGGYKVVQVFVAPEDPQTVPPPLPPDELKEALEGHLHSRMPVNRMAGVDVLDPQYVPIDVTVDVHLKGESSQSTVFQSVQSALRDLLSFARQDFGRPLRVGEVFATLYPLEGISHALLRRLARSGAAPLPGAACDFEDVAIAEHELAYAGVITINLFGGVR
jgi:baseplate J-like protein